MVLDDGFRNCTSQGASNSGFLGGDNATRLMSGLQHGFGIERFDGGHGDHSCGDALIVELLGCDQSTPEHRTVADQGDVVTVAESHRLAGRECVVRGIQLRTLIRLTRMNTGPSVSAAQRMAAAVSIGSAGTTMVMLSMARSQAMSSME